MIPRPTSVLVTGGTGFVGSRLVRALIAEGFDVHVLVRSTSSLEELAPVLAEVRLVEFGGSTVGLAAAVGRAHPDLVFHLASRFIAEHRPDQVNELIDSNVRFGAQLLEAMAVNGVRRLVNAGTSWQHFEGAEYRPVCLYAATKQAFEAILEFYVDARNLQTITLKLFDTYGADDPRPKLFSLLRSASQRDAVLEMSGGEQLVDLVYVDDVVDAFLMAGKRLLSGEAQPKEEFAVSSGKPMPLKDIVALYAAVCDVDLRVDWGARPYREREVMVPWHTGAALPGWSARTSLEDGIRLAAGLAVVK